MQAQLDDWLSGILGKQAFHLRIELQDCKSLAECMASLPAPSFCDLRIADCSLSIFHEAIGNGFVPFETSLYFELENFDHLRFDHSLVREAVNTDAQALEDIAASVFSCSRFSVDGRLGCAVSSKLNRAWVANFFRGARGDKMLVAQVGESVVGFNQLLFKNDGLWIIDLIGVLDEWRGRRVADSLLSAMKLYCPGLVRIGVRTQAANIRAVRFYEKAGFRLKSSEMVLHYHKEGR